MGLAEDLTLLVELGWDPSDLKQPVTAYEDARGVLHGRGCSRGSGPAKRVTLLDAARARSCQQCEVLPQRSVRLAGHASAIGNLSRTLDMIEEGALPLETLHGLLQGAQKQSEELDADRTLYTAPHGFDVRMRLQDKLARCAAQVEVALGGDAGREALVHKLALNAVSNDAYDTVRTEPYSRLLHPWSATEDGDELDLVQPWAEGVLDEHTPAQRLERVQDEARAWGPKPAYVDQLRNTPRRPLEPGEDPVEWLEEEWRLRRDEAVAELCTRWETQLQEALALPETAYVGYHHDEDSYWTQDLNTVLASWKPWRNGAVRTALVPGPVGYWLERQGWTRVPLPEGLTGPERDRVLETVAGLWGGDDESAPMSQVENVVEAALTVCTR